MMVLLGIVSVLGILAVSAIVGGALLVVIGGIINA